MNSKIARRSLIQLVAYVVGMVGGFLLLGWWGLAAGFGIVTVGLFIATAIRLKQLSKDEKAEEAAMLEEAMLAEGEAQMQKNGRTVRAPQDYRKKRR